MGCEGYTAVARVYDKLNAEIDYAAWADFIETSFNRYLSTRPTLVLDLACGTGSMTLELAKRGYDMIGVDRSAEMLSEAYNRSASQSGILWLQQDMRSFELYGTVGAITCCLDSLNYLLSPDDLTKCFSTVHNYLEPNGLFLFDMNTPYKFETIYGNNAYILEDELVWDEGTEEEERAAVFCGWQNSYQPSTRLCDFDLSIFEEMPDGSYRRSDEHQMERCYTMDEIRDALNKANLELVGVWSDYSFAPIDEKTERWYFAARAIKSV